MIKYLIVLILWIASSLTATAQEAGSLAPNDRIIVCGDSITYNGAATTTGWIYLWNQWNYWYHPNYNFTLLASGIPAQTSADLLARFQSSVLSNNPTVVVIEIGTNDVGRGVPLDEYIANLQEMINLANDYGGVRQIVFLTNWCIGEDMSNTGMDFYERSIAALAYSEGCKVIHTHTSWQSWEAAYNPRHAYKGVLTVDGVHFNNFGNQVAVRQMWAGFGE